MALLASIQSHVSETIQAGEYPDYVNYVNEILRILIYIVDEEDAKKYMNETTVTTDGLDISAMRFVQPHKNGIPAGIYPSQAYDAMINEDYKGLYQASATMPGAVIKDGNIYIFPGGGKITSFGVTPISNIASDDVTKMPLPFRSATVYYAAVNGLKKKMDALNASKALSDAPVIPELTLAFPTLSRETFTETLVKGAIPSAPADPSITADQAAAPSVTAPTLNSPAMSSGATGEQYTKTDLSLVFTKPEARALDDDIEMLNGENAILQKKLEEATVRMTDEMNRVNALIQGFNSKVSHSLEQGRLSMNATDSQAQLKLNQELSNAQTKLSALIREKEIIFQKYQQEASAILSDNQNNIADFQAKASVWARKNDLNVAEFTNHVQFVMGKYQADISTKLQQYQNTVSSVMANNNVRDSKIEGFTRNIALLLQHFHQAVQTYIRAMEMKNYIAAPVDPEVQG